MKTRLIALFLIFAVLLSGCAELGSWLNGGSLATLVATPFDQMEYTRPDMDAFQRALEDCCAASQTQISAQSLQEKVATEFYPLYYSFYTNYNLAGIYYFKDMTDIYWEQEYNYCLENSSQVEAWLEELNSTLADCPLREELEELPYFGEGFFDSYGGDSIWDEEFIALLNREAELQSRYYQLCTDGQKAPYYSEEFFRDYGSQMEELFVELIEVRREQASYVGYEDYPTFAYDFYHYRDYTPSQGEQYLLEICEELAPLYRQMSSNTFQGADATCSTSDTFTYVKNSAQAMGGTFQEAFALLEDAGLYDITYSEKKYNASFEVYLTDYYSPYVFVNPVGNQWDKLTFAHEFGHFCNDYASYGSMAGVDVAEVFSQGLEYLSLCYGENTELLTKMKLADCLSLSIEQSAYALFEHRVYDLQGEELTTENVRKLYEEIGTAFGFDSWNWDSRDYVLITHFFTDPLYIISYVVSNDCAFQIYQMEQETSGTGLALLEDALDTEQMYLLSFLEEVGLTSPFASGRVAQMAETLERVLQ